MKALVLALMLCCAAASAADSTDFRPLVAAAIQRGEKKIVIPPGTYRLAPIGGDKSVWTLSDAKDLEIEAQGVTLISTKLTRALALHHCSKVSIHGLSVDYDPLPFTQGTVTAVAEDKGWIDIKLHAGYPRQPYARIDVIDPATRYRKKGMPFLWGTKAELRGEDTVRVSLKDIAATALIGDLASLNTDPAADGIPHAVSLEHCYGITLRELTVHSAPGMGILEADGEGGTTYLNCRIVPGPRPPGATEDRLLSTSWDAMQAKTIRQGPHVEGCEIREAGDDSFSIQSSDFMVLKRESNKLIIASRDEYTTAPQSGDRLNTRIGGPEAKITSRRNLTREEARLDPVILAKLKDAPAWSAWHVSPKCIEVSFTGEPPFQPGDSLFSPDRMGNGFAFIKNHVHSSGRILLKAAGRMEDNLLDTPHALTVCPEIPGDAAAGIDGLIIRRNKILRAGWFCPAPWSASAGALSITAAAGPPKLRPAGIFANLVIEDNVFEDCSGPNLVLSSARNVTMRGNRFIRPGHEPPNPTGGSFNIAKDAVIWISGCENLQMGDNPILDPGPHLGKEVVRSVP